MSLMEQINADFKKAMLAHDDFAKTTINGLKSAIKYKEVEKGERAEGLSDDEIQSVVAKEVKSRNDSIEIYKKAGDSERADKEARERDILMAYLPKQLSEDEIKKVIQDIVEASSLTAKDFGRIMGAAKAKIGNGADGATISKVVKEYFN